MSTTNTTKHTTSLAGATTVPATEKQSNILRPEDLYAKQMPNRDSVDGKNADTSIELNQVTMTLAAAEQELELNEKEIGMTIDLDDLVMKEALEEPSLRKSECSTISSTNTSLTNTSLSNSDMNLLDSPQKDVSSGQLGTNTTEEINFTIVNIQTTCEDLKQPSICGNCFFYMKRRYHNMDHPSCLIIIFLIISFTLLTVLPAPLIGLGAYYVQKTKDTPTTDTTTDMFFTRYPCYVVGTVSCTSGPKEGFTYQISFPVSSTSKINTTSVRDNNDTREVTAKYKVLQSETCYTDSSSQLYSTSYGYICYTNKDENKVTLDEPAGTSNSNMINSGFQLLLFGVIGGLASICLNIALCCTCCILLEHKPWKQTPSASFTDYLTSEAAREASSKLPSKV